MRIPFSDIPEGGLKRVISDTGWSSGSELGFAEPPRAELALAVIDDRTVELKGRLVAEAESVCSRCGAAAEFVVDESFKYFFRVGEDSAFHQKEVECSREDCETVFIDEPEIDVDEVLAEQLVLAVPVKLLCSEECKGLCPKCGALLNNGQCNCEEDQPDSPFAVLKHLKK